ncbi:MAG: class I SAM-dependent methyltransferase [Chlamydiales bacterium]|nr:class I SAM-dependent methyltransferase [Chlamydiia bacterium]MCP5507691.1 class I SAM-dependent methyltransferase [Chlamydiales bacterium]
MGKLDVVQSDNKVPEEQKVDPFSRQEVQARFERLWLDDPEQFNPQRNCMERERIQRTRDLILAYVNPQGKKTGDLGCGYGALSLLLQKMGASVESIDIAANALKRLEGKGLELKQDFLPKTLVEDSYYDLVICTDVIGDVAPKVYRHFFAELARVVKDEGYVVCSTALDIDTDDALQRFAELAETELIVTDWSLSYHALYIRLKRFCRYLPLKGLHSWLDQSKKVLLFLEKITRLFWSETGMSHAIFIAKRKPLIPDTPIEFQPTERKHKKQVWE